MNSIVKRRPFGNTGLSVSEVSLGAMNLRKASTRAEAEKTVNKVLDLGINLIDTAFAYTGVNPEGEMIISEEVVGSVIKKRTDIDEPIVIITKNHGYTPDVFDEELAVSKERLGIEKKDGKLYIGSTEIKLVVFFHGILLARWQSMLETKAVEHAQELQKAGEFTYLGFSAHYADADTVVPALDSGAFQVMELPYNVFKRTVGEDGEINLQKYAYDRGVAIINMKTFNGNGMVETSKVIGNICNISYPDMLRFVLSNPWITTCDVGAKYDYEFESDVETTKLPVMTESERNDLKKIADRVSGMMDNICRECMHCLEKFECPQDVDFPAILGAFARYQIAQKLGKDTTPYLEAMKNVKEPGAAGCVGCGACLEWCEYHLNIPEEMAKVQEILG